MKQCLSCGAQMEDGAFVCARCGKQVMPPADEEVNGQGPRSKLARGGYATIFAGLLVFGVGLLMQGYGWPMGVPLIEVGLGISVFGTLVYQLGRSKYLWRFLNKSVPVRAFVRQYLRDNWVRLIVTLAVLVMMLLAFRQIRKYGR